MTDDLSQPPHGDDGNNRAPGNGAGGGVMVCGICTTTYGANMRFCPLDGAVLRPLTEGRSDLIGTIIDSRYHLTRKLGQGGMGDVYLGEHVRTQRLCAVKVITRSQSSDPDALGRFLREATNAGKISHPNVATVYDFGETSDGLFYLAMEFVNGEPLSMVLERERALTPQRAAEIARQVADGVSAAHEVGIVHRDLKPGNILIMRDRRNTERVKVVDFGIARTADEQQNLTRTGTIIGTPEYMSPEQLIGDTVDGRSDIYALGCIMYQMVTGEQAFGGPTAQVISRRLTERPPRPREKNAAVPDALDEVIVTMLGRMPQERYQTMEAVRDALLEAVPPPPATTGPRAQVTVAGLLPRSAAPDTAEATPVVPPAITAETPLTEQPVTGEPITAQTPDIPAASASGIFAAQLFESNVNADDIFSADDIFGASSARADDAAEDVGDEPAPEELVAAGTVDADAPTEAALPATPAVPAGTYISPPPSRRKVETPRGKVSWRKAALYTVPAVVAVLMFARFLTGAWQRDTNAQTPIVPADTIVPAPPPPPPPVPDQSVLDAVWLQLSVADSARLGLHFDSALATLRIADSLFTPVLAQFGAEPSVSVLADTLTKQRVETLNQCNALRTVRMARREPAPECKAE